MKDHYDYTAHIVTSVFSVSLFQYITLAVVFSGGPPYKRPFYTNREAKHNPMIVLPTNMGYFHNLLVVAC